MTINLKNKLKIELNETELLDLVREAVAKQLDWSASEINVLFEIKKTQEGMQWDPRVHAKISLVPER